MDDLVPGSLWSDEHGVVLIESVDHKKGTVDFWREKRRSFRMMEICYFLRQFTLVKK